MRKHAAVKDPKSGATPVTVRNAMDEVREACVITDIYARTLIL